MRGRSDFSLWCASLDFSTTACSACFFLLTGASLLTDCASVHFCYFENTLRRGTLFHLYRFLNSKQGFVHRKEHDPALPFLQFSSVHLLSHVWLFVIPRTAAYQASLSITNSWSLLKLMSIESVMPFNHLILCHPLLLPPSIFPSIRVFFQWVTSLHQVVKVLEFQLQPSVLPLNIQDWFPLGWTGWISLQSKGLSRVFSNTTVQKHQFFSAQLSL